MDDSPFELRVATGPEIARLGREAAAMGFFGLLFALVNLEALCMNRSNPRAIADCNRFRSCFRLCWRPTKRREAMWRSPALL